MNKPAIKLPVDEILARFDEDAEAWLNEVAEMLREEDS